MNKNWEQPRFCKRRGTLFKSLLSWLAVEVCCKDILNKIPLLIQILDRHKAQSTNMYQLLDIETTKSSVRSTWSGSELQRRFFKDFSVWLVKESIIEGEG